MLQWRDPATGRLRTKHIGDISKTAARHIRATLENDLLKKRLGIFTGDSSVTLSILRDEYIYAIRKDRSQTTVNLTNRAFNNLIAYGGDVLITSLTSRDIEEWMSSLKKANSSVNIEFRHLKAAFNRAVEWYYIDYSPFNRVKQLKTVKKQRQVIPQNHVIRLLDNIDDPKDHAFYAALYYTGARSREIYQLRWQHIDLQNDIINLEAETTKGKKDRLVYIHPVLHRVIDALPRVPGLVFPQYTQSWQVAKAFKKHLEKAGLPDHYSPKWLRHTFATTLISETKDTMGTKEILGHSSIAVTELYTHYNMSQQKAIIAALPDVVKPEKRK